MHLHDASFRRHVRNDTIITAATGVGSWQTSYQTNRLETHISQVEYGREVSSRVHIQFHHMLAIIVLRVGLQLLVYQSSIDVVIPQINQVKRVRLYVYGVWGKGSQYSIQPWDLSLPPFRELFSVAKSFVCEAAVRSHPRVRSRQIAAIRHTRLMF